jgi:hypothetical protein
MFFHESTPVVGGYLIKLAVNVLIVAILRSSIAPRYVMHSIALTTPKEFAAKHNYAAPEALQRGPQL